MISIIVPVLNEAKNIGPLLRHLDTHLKNPEEAEVLIVDGGSTDGTPAIAESFIGNLKYTLASIPSAPGRGSQMNKGAKQARGSILYFLHVDSLPPAGFDVKIKEYVANGHLAGCFRMRFDDNHVLLRFCQWFTRINMKFCRGGDQSLFIDSAKFEELGGYNETYGIYEDCEFTGRLYDAKIGFAVIPDTVTTSARKYKTNGTWRLQYHFTVIHLKRFFGAGPEQLVDYYKKYIR